MSAIVTEEQSVSWSEFEHQVDEMVVSLQNLKLPPRASALVHLGNSVELFVCLRALRRLDVIAILVDPKTPQKSIEYILALTKPNVVIDTNNKSPTLLHVERAEATYAAPLETRYVLFSSGSTGHPKGVPLSETHFVAAQQNMKRVFSPLTGHRELLLSPATHMDGLQRALMTLNSKGTLYLQTSPTSPNAIVDLLEQFQIQGLYIPPAIVSMFTDSLEKDLPPTLLHIEVGSAAHSSKTLATLQNRIASKNLVIHYGLTECSRATLVNLRESPDKIRTVGRIHNDLQIEIVDESFQPLGPNQTGMIRLRGGQTVSAYWGGLHSERFQDGWFATQDYGSLDADGFLTFSGRKDDLLTRSGYHVFPAEIEATIGPISGVREYSLVGIPHSLNPGNDELVLFYVADSADASSVRQLVATRLSDFLRPNRIVFVDKLPRTPSGKVDRKKLRDSVE
jgi:long-chain acyl-CoA synthetase